MADALVYDGHPVFVPNAGMTPFAFYDNDTVFQTDAPKVARFCASRLGWPLMEVELQSGSFFTAFEEAVTTYGNQIYAWKVKENYLSLEGGSTDIPANNMVLEPSLQRIVEISKNYGSEAEVGGNITLHKGILDLKVGVQDYDLDLWAKNQGIEGGIEIRRIFYEAPPAVLRYFDPYAGTGTGIQSLMEAFGFGQYSPGINFLLMPVSADILQIQAIEFNDQVRKSGYSFKLVNNQLTIFPIPQLDGKLRIEYYKLSDKRKLNTGADNIYPEYSTWTQEFTASAEETVTFTHDLNLNLTQASNTEQFFLVEGDGMYQMIPDMFTVSNETSNSFKVTFHIPVEHGKVIMQYKTLEAGEDGTIYCKYSAPINVNVAESNVQKVIHTLQTEDVSVQVFEDNDDGTSSLMLPGEVKIVNNHEIDLYFSSNIKGHVVLTAAVAQPSAGTDVITNVSEVPYENPTYSKINSIGRQWIYRYTLALAKEMLAYVRGKYTSLPIPDSEATLNQQDLLADARTEKADLLKELNDMLDTSSRKEQLNRKAEESEALQKTLTGIPMVIYIG